MKETNERLSRFSRSIFRQDEITGSGAIPDADPSSPRLAGRTLQAGTYKFPLPVFENSSADVSLRLASHMGVAPTAKLYKLLSDVQTEKRDSTGASAAIAFGTFTDDTQLTASITELVGERYIMLEVTVPDTASFDKAEYSAK